VTLFVWTPCDFVCLDSSLLLFSSGAVWQPAAAKFYVFAVVAWNSSQPLVRGVVLGNKRRLPVGAGDFVSCRVGGFVSTELDTHSWLQWHPSPGIDQLPAWIECGTGAIRLGITVWAVRRDVAFFVGAAGCRHCCCCCCCCSTILRRLEARYERDHLFWRCFDVSYCCERKRGMQLMIAGGSPSTKALVV
jgi:hypothetical protein